MNYILITGDPVIGFEFYGPYPSAEAGATAAEKVFGEGGGDYWVAPIQGEFK